MSATKAVIIGADDYDESIPLIASVLTLLDPGQSATVTYLEGDKYKVEFDEPQIIDDIAFGASFPLIEVIPATT